MQSAQVRVLDGVALRLSSAERRAVRQALLADESRLATNAEAGVALVGGEWLGAQSPDAVSSCEWLDGHTAEAQRLAGRHSRTVDIASTGELCQSITAALTLTPRSAVLTCCVVPSAAAVLRDCALLRRCGVRVVVCVGSVDALVSSACAESRLAVLSCVSERTVSRLSGVTGATLLPHARTAAPALVGRAAASLVQAGWADESSERLLLSPVPSSTPQSDQPAAASVCVLSRHPSAAHSAQFDSAVWSCLCRLRNARRDGRRAWRGGGETEIECIRQLVLDRQETLARLSSQQQPIGLAALCRPLALDAWIDSLRQLLRLTLLNTGCTQQQADSIAHSSARLKQHSTKRQAGRQHASLLLTSRGVALCRLLRYRFYLSVVNAPAVLQ